VGGRGKISKKFEFEIELKLKIKIENSWVSL
jgi:hypothetical protein